MSKGADFNEIAVFVEVAKLGSFSQAARQLAMPNSTVSTRVSSLESRLGTTLITRTTRRLSLTPAGKHYFERCLLGMSEIENAESEVVSGIGLPQGLLRVTAPSILGSQLLPDVVAKFLNEFPKIELDLILADRVVDMVAEGIDVALRAGELKDSSLMIKKLGQTYFAPFASPAYLKKAGTPEHPKDLRSHRCLQFAPLGREKWEFTSDRSRVSVALEGKLIADDLGLIKELALRGSGIALLPTFLCGLEAESRKLVRLLPSWISNKRQLSFVYPAQKFANRRLEAFIDHAAVPLSARLSELEL